MAGALTVLREFFGRYARVFKAAWSVRDKMDPPPRQGQELEFLPAHLELTDTPVSPASRWIMRAIMALFCVALLWACLGQLDIVAVATGKTVSSGRTKVVQPLEPGVVRRILVRDGQQVKQGDLLIELDSTASGADFARAGEALQAAKLAELRFRALHAAIDSGTDPVLPELTGIEPARLSAERQLALSQHASFRARRQTLDAIVAQREAELATTTELVTRLEESAQIVIARAADFRDLVEKKYVARHEYLALEQERIAAERDLATQRNRLVEIRSALAGAREERRSMIADTRQQLLDGLRQAEDQVRQLTPEVAKTGRRDNLMQLTAPVDGVVQQLAVHTVGGVVTEAQPLLAVVPEDETLEVEALVLNKDIGFVRAGQTATVKVESFPYTRYGYLTGTVENVSLDAMQHEELGLVFQARVKLDRAHLDIDGVRVKLTPGMGLSVEVKTGKRTVIDYLLSPLKVHISESVRER
jgi:hemolysin D